MLTYWHLIGNIFLINWQFYCWFTMTNSWRSFLIGWLFFRWKVCDSEGVATPDLFLVISWFLYLAISRFYLWKVGILSMKIILSLSIRWLYIVSYSFRDRGRRQTESVEHKVWVCVLGFYLHSYEVFSHGVATPWVWVLSVIFVKRNWWESTRDVWLVRRGDLVWVYCKTRGACRVVH